MNIKEHIFMLLSEECAEVAQVVSKILRFGPDNIGPGHDQTNKERLEEEIADILGVIGLLRKENMISDIDPKKIKAKGEKIKRYMQYSKDKGTLQ